MRTYTALAAALFGFEVANADQKPTIPRNVLEKYLNEADLLPNAEHFVHDELKHGLSPDVHGCADSAYCHEFARLAKENHSAKKQQQNRLHSLTNQYFVVPESIDVAEDHIHASLAMHHPELKGGDGEYRAEHLDMQLTLF